MMTRENILDILYVASPLYISKEAFSISMDGWDLEDHYEDGECIVITLRKEAEVHFHSMGRGRSLPWVRFKKFMQGVIDEHGYLETKTPKTYERQIKFNELIGFFKIGESEFDIHYRIEKIRG